MGPITDTRKCTSKVFDSHAYPPVPTACKYSKNIASRDSISHCYSVQSGLSRDQEIPDKIRNCSNYNTFLSLVNKFLINRAEQCN